MNNPSRIAALVLLSAALVSALAACSVKVNPDQGKRIGPDRGAHVTVHLRGDVFLTFVAPQEPLNSLNGVVERVGREWILLAGGNRRYWIPRDAILLVEPRS